MKTAKDKCTMKRQFWRAALGVAGALLIYLFVLVPLVQGLTAPTSMTLTPSEYARLAATDETPTGPATNGDKSITIKLFGFIPIKKVPVNILPFDTVLIGGLPIGICGQIDGVLITADTADHGLQKGDLVQAVDGVPTTDLATFRAAIADRTQARCRIIRHQKTLERTVNFTSDIAARDQTNGVGVLTFINPANNTFAALGHPMGDFETGTSVNLIGGTVRPVRTYGIVKTQGQQTGMMQSSIVKNAAAEGSITQGNAFGVTGCLFPDSQILAAATTTMPLATRYQVKPGAATLRTSLDGVTVEEFRCEIIKTRYQNRKSDKSMIIRVTDPRLLAATGGIIHGMSGSPIIQDGHVVGALTHAMTRDPAKGYAIYVDFMTI